MNKAIMLAAVMLSPVLVGDIDALVWQITQEITNATETLDKEQCKWPYCGEVKYEICLMPDGCTGK